MWISYRASHLLAIRIFVSGVNAVSGKPAIDTQAIAERRLAPVDLENDRVNARPQGQWVEEDMWKRYSDMFKARERQQKHDTKSREEWW